MKTTVIYHSADFDGIFSREVARLHFGENANYIGWNHGDAKIPMPEEGEVWIIDLSPDCIDERAAGGDVWSRVVWIDHHKSSIEKYAGYKIRGYRIDGVAACRLAMQWVRHMYKTIDTLPEKEEYINRTVSEPWSLRLAGEYDIWDKRDPDAELFQHGLRSQPIEDLFPKILQFSHDSDLTVQMLLSAGKGIQYARRVENESIIKELGFTFEWEGLKFLTCNHARYNSHLFTAGLKPEHDACFGFKFDGEKWSISLYHAPGKEHHDLSLIASKYGGGGHRGACGFQTKTLPIFNS